MFTITHLSCDNMAVLITLRAIFLCLSIIFFSSIVLVPLGPDFSCTELGIGLLPVWT